MKKYIVPKATDLELKSATILASSGSGGSSSGDGPDGGESTTPVSDGGAAKAVVPTFNFD